MEQAESFSVLNESTDQIGKSPVYNFRLNRSSSYGKQKAVMIAQRVGRSLQSHTDQDISHQE